MVSVLASSAIDRGVKPNFRNLLCVAYLLSTQHLGESANTVWLGIRILCPSSPSREICLFADWCFSELAL